MEVKKNVTPQQVTYWIYGTEREIKEYFRNQPIIPAHSIVIHTFDSQKAWDKFLIKYKKLTAPLLL